MDDVVSPTTERVSDPHRIRALAHPLRLELMAILRDGPATATRCAAITGESAASCSFHLRMLAKYGYIELGERRGREKRWRLVAVNTDIRPDEGDPASRQAVGVMAQVFVEHAAEQTRAWLARVDGEHEAWVQASTLTTSSFWATADELAEVSRVLQTVADRFEHRRNDPGARPPGARPVRVFATAHVDVAAERRAAGGAPGAESAHRVAGAESDGPVA